MRGRDRAGAHLVARERRRDDERERVQYADEDRRAVLLVEHHAGSREELQAKLNEVVDVAQYRTGLAAAAHIADDENSRKKIDGMHSCALFKIS